MPYAPQQGKVMLPDYQTVQYAFAKHIRHPEKYPAPEGIEDRRMGIYRELFFNNIESFIAKTFPVMKRLFTETQWLFTVRDFIDQHCSHSPFFLDIPKEFLNYLENEYDGPVTYPFLLELAHYEWVELALDVSEHESVITPDEMRLANLSAPTLLQCSINASPLAWFFEYNYPVHQISPDNIPEQSVQTLLLIYRNTLDKVKFLHLNAMTAQLFVIIQTQQGLTFESILNQFKRMNPSMNEEVLRVGLIQQIDTFVEQSIFGLVSSDL